MALTEDAEALKVVTCPMLAFKISVHPLASVIVTLTVPTGKLTAVKPASPLDQLYVYGPVPPLAAVTVAVPLVPLAQETLVVDEMLDESAAISVMLIELVEVHPWESVMVTV